MPETRLPGECSPLTPSPAERPARPACHQAAPPAPAPTDRPASGATPSAAAEPGPAPCPQRTQDGAGSQPEQSPDPDPDPDPGVCPSPGKARGLSQAADSVWLVLPPAQPTSGIWCGRLRPVRRPGERGEPGRLTAAVASARAAGEVNTTLPSPRGQRPCWRVDTSGRRPSRDQTGQGWAPAGDGAHRTAHCCPRAQGGGKGSREKGHGAGGQRGLRSCTGLTRSPQIHVHPDLWTPHETEASADGSGQGESYVTEGGRQANDYCPERDARRRQRRERCGREGWEGPSPSASAGRVAL